MGRFENWVLFVSAWCVKYPHLLFGHRFRGDRLKWGSLIEDKTRHLGSDILVFLHDVSRSYWTLGDSPRQHFFPTCFQHRNIYIHSLHRIFSSEFVPSPSRYKSLINIRASSPTRLFKLSLPLFLSGPLRGSASHSAKCLHLDFIKICWKFVLLLLSTYVRLLAVDWWDW